MIEFDIETTGIQWYAHKVFLVAFYDGTTAVTLRHPADREQIQAWLDKDDDYRAWNAKFDLHFLEAAGYRLPDSSRWHDGMVAAHIVNEQRSVALKAVGASMFGEAERDTEKEVKKWLNEEASRRRKASKANGTKFVAPDYSDVPDSLMLPYAEQDVVLTRGVCDQLDRTLDSSQELRDLYNFERKVTGALYRVEKRGMPVDEQTARKFELHLADHLEVIEQRCIELAGIKSFNPNSSPQVAEALKRRGADLKFCTRTKTGISMDAESLGTVDDELAAAVLEFRGEYKNLSTYVRPMLHESYDSGLRCIKAPFIQDGRIHPNFRQVGARTGRMSCSDPNVQNWPRDDLRLRYLLRAEPGYKLVAADLSSIELVLFAAYAGDGAMLEAVLSGRDLHTMTAENVGLTERVRTTGVESKRQRGKTFNYSMIYGAGVRSLRKAFGVSQEEARQMIQRYHAAYPEVGRLQNQVQWRLEDNGYVKTMWGRRQRIAPRDAYKAVNAMIQGTAADMFKEALIRLDGQGYGIVVPNHDEFVLHVPEEEAEQAKLDVVEALIDHPRITKLVPLDAEAMIVDRWSQAKDPDFVPEFV